MQRFESPGGAELVVDGRPQLTFGGYGCPGSACEPAPIGAESEAREFFGVDGATHLATGCLAGFMAAAGLAPPFDAEPCHIFFNA